MHLRKRAAGWMGASFILGLSGFGCGDECDDVGCLNLIEIAVRGPGGSPVSSFDGGVEIAGQRLSVICEEGAVAPSADRRVECRPGSFLLTEFGDLRLDLTVDIRSEADDEFIGVVSPSYSEHSSEAGCGTCTVGQARVDLR